MRLASSKAGTMMETLIVLGLTAPWLLPLLPALLEMLAAGALAPARRELLLPAGAGTPAGAQPQLVVRTFVGWAAVLPAAWAMSEMRTPLPCSMPSGLGKVRPKVHWDSLFVSKDEGPSPS